jgi:hypothetical protein
VLELVPQLRFARLAMHISPVPPIFEDRIVFLPVRPNPIGIRGTVQCLVHSAEFS